MLRLHRENTHLAAFDNTNGRPGQSADQQPRMRPVAAESMMSERTASALPPADLIERLPKLVNENPAMLRRGRYLTTDMMVEIGATPFHLAIAQGRIECLSRGPLLMRSWSFAIRGGDDAWRRFWAWRPMPDFHDIFALRKFGQFRIDGDFRPLMTNLLYFKALLEAPRALANDFPR